MSSWLDGRSSDGGLDEIPLPLPTGRLWLCGKHLVGPDPDAALVRAEHASVLVCMSERHELADRYPDYVTWLTSEAEKERGRALWFSTPDLHAPELAVARTMVADVQERLDGDEGVVIHCGAGIGRAPTLAILVLMGQGMADREARTLVAAERPMAGPESGAQTALVEEYAAFLDDAGEGET